jgi:vesicle-associated membrane protein 7
MMTNFIITNYYFLIEKKYINNKMSKNQNIKNLIIGNIDTDQIITEYSLNSSSESNKEIKKLFNKMLQKKQNLNVGGRNKINSNDQCYYYTILSNYLYLMLVKENYPERIVYKLIDKIEEDKIPLMINEKTNQLNSNGNQLLKKLIEEYQDLTKVDKIKDIQNDINDIKGDLKKGINKMVENVENVQNLEVKADNLKENAKVFHKKSEEVKRKSFWMNCKFWVIIFGIFLILIAVFILSFVRGGLF